MWYDYIKLDLSQKNLLAILQPLQSFYLGATYDTLTSLTNLYRWHIAPEAVCFLCSKQVSTLAHILGACRVVLQQGRFTVPYDMVLRCLILSIKSLLTSYQVCNTKCLYIKFVKAGSRLQKTSKKTTADCYIVHQTEFFCLVFFDQEISEIFSENTQ